ncbi:secreted protein, putative, partial [Ixodes scapularis]
CLIALSNVALLLLLPSVSASADFRFPDYRRLICAGFIQLSDQSCSTGWNCYRFAKGSFCQDGFCVCRFGYSFGLRNGRLQCVGGLTFGESCSDQRPCSTISRTFCYNGSCLCEEDYVFYEDRCERQAMFSKHDVDSYVSPPTRFNLLTILIIVAILVVALLFLVNKRSLFFYFPCCMRDTVNIPGILQAESGASTNHPVNAGILGTTLSPRICVFGKSMWNLYKPPSYMETVLNVQYLPSYQEAANLPPSPKPS